LRLLSQEDPRWGAAIVRGRRYLINIVEQDHRASKRRYASMLGFKSFWTAAVTLSGIALAHRIRKRQFVFERTRPRNSGSLQEQWARALAWFASNRWKNQDFSWP
jgi:transposase-like protein